MMKTRLPSLMFITLTACGTSITRTDLNPAPRPLAARPASSVEVFTSGAPARPHVDVALLEAEESSSWSTASTGDMIGSLRARAASIGCDAVVISAATSRDPGITDKESLFVEHPRGRKGLFATCVVYSDLPPLVTAR